MGQSKSSPEVIAFLEEILEQAKTGEITDVFLWLKAGDKSTDYTFLVDDIDDMLYELGTAILTERIEGPGTERALRKQ